MTNEESYINLGIEYFVTEIKVQICFTSSHLMNFSPMIMEGGTDTCFNCRTCTPGLESAIVPPAGLHQVHSSRLSVYLLSDNHDVDVCFHVNVSVKTAFGSAVGMTNLH